jgi:PAS domain S-box-containing protein
MKVTKGSSPETSAKQDFKDFQGAAATSLNGIFNSILAQNDSPYIQLLQQLPAAVYTCNARGEITFYNNSAAQLWGRQPQIGKDLWSGFWKIFYPDGSPMAPEDCPMALALKEERAIEGREIIIERPDGKRLHILPHPRPLFDSAGKLAGAVNMLFDITEHREANNSFAENQNILKQNEELRRSEERYHRMIAEVEDYAIILLDKEGVIENWNKGAEKIKGYKAEEILGKNFRVFYSEGDRKSKLPDQLLERARREGRANHEGWRVRKDGTMFWGNIVITSLHDVNNNVIGFSKVTRDLSNQKNSEAELQRKNKELEAMNQELASFAYVSSHDLQEPLRKIQTFASRILETENENLSERGKDYFMRMQNAALRMQNLIEDLLAYSRTNTAEKVFERTDLNEILNEVRTELKEVIEEKNAIVTSDPLPTLDIVPFQVHQLLTNVISNALKFSRQGVQPEINITTEVVKGKDIDDTHVISTKDYQHIAITDNGIGFEPEHSKRIFEVFQRLHGRNEYSGTGIGLAICKKIMDNHNGIINAESELDKGATFNLYFPLESN